MSRVTVTKFARAQSPLPKCLSASERAKEEKSRRPFPSADYHRLRFATYRSTPAQAVETTVAKAHLGCMVFMLFLIT